MALSLWVVVILFHIESMGVRKRRWNEAVPSLSGATTVAIPESTLHVAQIGGTGTHSRPPEIAHGCLLIPVVAAVWWLWTKKQARKVMSFLLLRPQDPDEADEDNLNPNGDRYDSWEDLPETRAPQIQIVRWIKGKSHRSKRRVKAVSRRILGRRSRRRTNESVSSTLDEAILSDGEDNSVVSAETLSSMLSGGQWESLPSADGIELCQVPSTAASADRVAVVPPNENLMYKRIDEHIV